MNNQSNMDAISRRAFSRFVSIGGEEFLRPDATRPEVAVINSGEPKVSRLFFFGRLPEPDGPHDRPRTSWRECRGYISKNRRRTSIHGGLVVRVNIASVAWRNIPFVGEPRGRGRRTGTDSTGRGGGPPQFSLNIFLRKTEARGSPLSSAALTNRGHSGARVLIAVGHWLGGGWEKAASPVGATFGPSPSDVESGPVRRGLARQGLETPNRSWDFLRTKNKTKL